MLPEDNIRPHLKVLDLEPGVSMDEVKRAYRVMVKVWHPDRFMDDPALRNVAQEKLKTINASYDWLLQHWDEVDNSSLNRDTTASSASENPAGTEDHRSRRSGTRRVNAQTVWTVIVIGLFVIVAQAAWRNADRISFRSSIPSAAPVETRPELSGNDKEVAPNLSTQPSPHNDGRLPHSNSPLEFSSVPTERDRTWLDKKLLNWNTPGASVPVAPPLDSDMLKRCGAGDPASSPEERILKSSGWLLFESLHDFRGMEIVGAMADMDGMCRINAYQYFVFVNGIYAGSLSPVLSHSRSDGSLISVTFPSPESVSATFDRYTDKDALCCPSRISTAVYKVQWRDGKPVVDITEVQTEAGNR